VEAEEARAPVGQWEVTEDRENYERVVFAADAASLEPARIKGRALSFEAAVDEALGSADVSQVESPP
jgi:hypothetical protein